MADVKTMSAAVDAARKPGAETSEFHLAQYVSYAGILVTLLGAVFAVLPDSVVSSNHYVAVAVMVVGSITKVMATLGYAKSRVTLKAAILDAATAFAPNEVPIVKVVEDMVPDAAIPNQPPATATGGGAVPADVVTPAGAVAPAIPS